MRAFYNEIDPYCCAWISNLMDAGLITPGTICDRSVADLRPDDVVGYERVHFFAGIAVWDYALNLAGWGDEEIWTGSCPCQPFSSAGKGDGAADPRHLWPAWFRLIAERKPHAVFGEQVSGVDGFAWLDLVHADLEASDYAVGAVTLPAASVGAPHGRHRIFWVADRARDGRREERADAGRLAARDRAQGVAAGLGAGGVAERVAGVSGAEVSGVAVSEPRLAGPTSGFWRDAEWLWCRDEKYRPAIPAAQLLAHGFAADVGVLCPGKTFPNRVGLLRGFGNAINARVAEAFIRAYRDAR